MYIRWLGETLRFSRAIRSSIGGPLRLRLRLLERLFAASSALLLR